MAVHQAHLRYLPSHSVMRTLFYVKEGRTDQTLLKGEDVDVYVWQLAFFLSLFALLLLTLHIPSFCRLSISKFRTSTTVAWI